MSLLLSVSFLQLCERKNCVIQTLLHTFFLQNLLLFFFDFLKLRGLSTWIVLVNLHNCQRTLKNSEIKGKMRWQFLRYIISSFANVFLKSYNKIQTECRISFWRADNDGFFSNIVLQLYYNLRINNCIWGYLI